MPAPRRPDSSNVSPDASAKASWNGTSGNNFSPGELSGESTLRLTLLLTALGAALRFSTLTRQSFWYDEAVSVALARNPVADLLTGRVRDLGNPPLYPALLHLWTSIFGVGDGAVRALSALFGTLTIPVLLAVGRKALPSNVAVVGATLLAVSPFHLQMAQEARAYTLLALLGTLATFALLLATEAPRRLGPWLLLAVSTAALALTHYFGFFLAVAHAAYLGTAHRRDRQILLRGLAAYALAAAIFAFWLPQLFAQLGVQGNLARSAESWYLHLVATPLVFAYGTTLVWKDNAHLFRLILGGLGALAFAGAAGFGLYQSFFKRWLGRTTVTNGNDGGTDQAQAAAERRPTRLLILWLVLPVLIPAAISVLASPLYNTRYVILASLPFYLFAAAGLLALPQHLRTATAGVIVLAMGASTLSYLSRPVKHQWREAAAFIEAVREPNDRLLFNADYTETSYAHYAGASGQRIRLLPAPVSPQGSPGATDEATRGADATPRLFGAAGAGAPTEDVGVRLGGPGRVWLISADPDRDVAAQATAFFAKWTARPITSLRGIDIQLFESPR